MLVYPEIDPVALALGPIKIHWYGITYLVAFALAWWLGRVRAERHGWKKADIEELIFYGAVGLVLGGRIGYIVFYNFSDFLDNPIILFKVWQGGMSFHGGLIGGMAALWLFSRRYKKGFFEVLDFTAPLVPLGLGSGRIGNFINSELWGRPTDLPWAMVFPNGGDVARHPSMLYEFLLEGVLLFAIIWWFSSRPRPAMAVSGLFLMSYGAFRFMVEFVRQPDAHMGYIAWDWLTQGQILSVPLVIAGIFLITTAYRRS
ncbi:MAG: prolipoprotein diacylglyceryl transferase [Gammaproteobacteria bacterium]|nr:prolipoprotein diacylglyceryl transferase [Gammaproteobacteria bacterium]